MDARTSELGRAARATGVAVDADEVLLADDVVLNGITIRAAEAADDLLSSSYRAASAIAKAEAINDVSAFSGVRALVNATRLTGGGIGAVSLDSDSYVVINGEVVTGFQVAASDGAGALVDGINAVADRTGVVATLGADYNLHLEAADGRNIAIETFGSGASTGLTAGVYGGSLTLVSDDLVEVEFAPDANAKIGFFPVFTAGAEGPFDLEPLDVLRLDVNDTGNADAVFDGIAEISRSGGGPYDLEPGSTLSIRIDGGAAQSFSFQASAATQRSVAGPYDLEPGQTLQVRADGGAVETVTFTGVAEVQRSGAGVFDLADGDTLSVRVDGGAVQTVTFNAGAVGDIDAVTRAEAAAILGAGLTGAQVIDDGGGVRITSDVRGYASSV